MWVSQFVIYVKPTSLAVLIETVIYAKGLETARRYTLRTVVTHKKLGLPKLVSFAQHI